MKFKHLLLILALTLIGISSQSASAKVYLVAVGIGDYPGKENDLRLPKADADTIEWLYRRNAKASTVKLVNSRASKANIIHAMEQLYSQAKPDDMVVLFFSGHGYKGGFVAHDGFLSYKQIRKAMSRSRSRHKVIFADACFSGNLRSSNTRNTRADDAEANAARKADVLLFLSSRNNEISWESSNMSNGIFTEYLHRGLRGKADTNGDRIISAKELFEYVSANVQRASRKAQHPVMWGKFPNEMPLMRW